MATNKTISVSSATGGTVGIKAYHYRKQLWIRNVGPDTVWMGLNTTAIADQGFFLEIGDGLIIDGEPASRDFYFVCDTGETATVTAEVQFETQERIHQSSSSSSSSSSSIDSSSSESSQSSSSSSSVDSSSSSSESTQSESSSSESTQSSSSTSSESWSSQSNLG